MSAEDPIVCYIIVRSELKMGPGKICAQVGHAIQHLMECYFKVMLIETKLHMDTIEHPHVELMRDWLKEGSQKVVLAAVDKQWDTIKQEYKKGCFVVKDAGKTEVAPGSETVLALWPDYKSKASSTIKQMPLFK